MKFKLKFFGANNIKHEPLRKIIEVVEAESECEAIDMVKRKYERINGIKISKIRD